MKLLTKIGSILIAIVMPISAFAADQAKGGKGSSQSSTSSSSTNPGNNASGSTNLGTTPSNTNTNPNQTTNNAVTTTPGADTYNTGNPNNTGTTVFDNNTGKIGSTSTRNTTNQGYPNGQMPADMTQTKRNVATQSRQLTLTGLKAQDRGKVIQFARQAGATTAKIEGDTLNYTGTEFNREKFDSLMTGTLPRLGVQDPNAN